MWCTMINILSLESTPTNSTQGTTFTICVDMRVQEFTEKSAFCRARLITNIHAAIQR